MLEAGYWMPHHPLPITHHPSPAFSPFRFFAFSLFRFFIMIELAPDHKFGLSIATPVLPAAGTFGYGEAYRDLVVRVSGFSALYVELSDEVQRDILARSEH